MAFGFYSAITIDHTKCGSSDSSNFTVLVNTTDTRFKTVGNGGHVQSSSGFDIRPYLTDGTTALSFELERYNASTGEVVMWVKLSTVSHSSDTIFRLYYGDSGISTDGSSTGAWDSSFLVVYHFKDGTTLSTADSTSNANNGTNNNGVTAVAGQIDGAGGFASASTQSVSSANTLGTITNVTISAWVKATSFPNSYNSVVGGNTGNFAMLYVKSNGKLACYTTGSNYDGTGSHTLSSGTWYHLAMTYSTTTGLVGYVNAASDGTQGAGTSPGSIGAFNVGRDPSNSGRLWNGLVDEPRIESVARSADWITTEYNNQNSPSTFYTVGIEQVPSTATGGGFFGLM